MDGLLKYPLHTVDGVTTFLQNYNQMKERIYTNSDFTALILMIDFEKALMNAGLTERELYVISLVFISDLKQVTVAEMLSVTKQTISTTINRGVKKIADFHSKEGVESE